jgi:hypothetical protein
VKGKGTEILNRKILVRTLGCSYSVAEHVLNMCEALGLIPTTKQNKEITVRKEKSWLPIAFWINDFVSDCLDLENVPVGIHL